MVSGWKSFVTRRPPLLPSFLRPHMTYIAVFSRRFVWAWWPTFALIQYSFFPPSSMLLRRLYLEFEHWMSENGKSLLLTWINEVDPSKYMFNKLEMQSWGTQKRYVFHLVDIERTRRCLSACVGALLPWEIHESRVYTIHNRITHHEQSKHSLDWRLYLAFSISMNLCVQWWKAERWHYKCFLNG